jgi:hypothetical protein
MLRIRKRWSNFDSIAVVFCTVSIIESPIAYSSEWIRAGKEKPTQDASYLSDGKLVIGVHGNNGAIVNTIGLIFQ